MFKPRQPMPNNRGPSGHGGRVGWLPKSTQNRTEHQPRPELGGGRSTLCRPHLRPGKGLAFPNLGSTRTASAAKILTVQPSICRKVPGSSFCCTPQRKGSPGHSEPPEVTKHPDSRNSLCSLCMEKSPPTFHKPLLAGPQSY